MQTLRTNVLRLLLGALLAFAPSSARGGQTNEGAGVALIVYGGGPVVVAIETLGTIGAVKAGLEASRGHRTSTGWLTMGYLSGLANLTGAVFLLRAGSNAANDGAAKSAFYAIGAFLLAWGATNLGLSIWGLQNCETWTQTAES
jgi:hypothetical protein